MMTGFERISCAIAAALSLALSAAPASAQTISVVAVPQFSTPQNVETPAGHTGVLARRISDQIAADLRSTGDVVPLGVERLRVYSYPETTAPAFPHWRTTGAKALMTGFVQARADGRVTVGCYLYDIREGRELARQGFAVAPAEWRRAAHRCADSVMLKLTGKSGGFESLVAYVAESGARTELVKRIALMESDGTSHRFVTAGDSTVLTPRLSPGGDQLAYVSFTGGRPQVRLRNIENDEDRILVPNAEMSFAPRFAPDGRSLLISTAEGGDTDIYSVSLDGREMRRLTATPGTDTSASFSPDGSRIVFESDRSGQPQLYVMNADGSAPRRISFGGGRYGSPVWSPDGERIAFTRMGGDGLRIGVLAPDGSGERILTPGPFDEGPSWAGSGSLMFQRGGGPGTRTMIYSVPLAGGPARAVATPQGASDPDVSRGGAQ